MSKKNKIMLAVAIAAVILFVGSGIARCSLERADADRTEAVEAQSGVGNDEGESIDAQETAESAIERGGSKEAGLDAFLGTSWQALDDPARTLTIVQGAFVEVANGQNDVTYFKLDSEDETQEGLAATILASKSVSEAAAPATLTIGKEGPSEILACDALASKYVRVQPSGRTLAFERITDKLAESMGADAAAIEAAVAERAAVISPAAECATWDGEVWCDFVNDVATTTFTLGDGASTIVSVTRYEDGTIEAL